MLPELIEVHRTLADEFLIVDSGSTDGTPAMAKHLGVRVEHIDWPGDFGEARNQAIRLSKGEWILMIDADERLSAPDQARLKLLLQKQSCPAVFGLIQRTYTDNAEVLHWRPCQPGDTAGKGAAGFYDIRLARLFPKRSDLHFEGIIHERLESSAQRANIPLVQTNLVLHHFKEKQSLEKQTAKNDLYLALSRKKHHDRPDCTQAALEHAMAAGAFELYEEAISALKPSVEQHPESSQLASYLGVMLCRSGRFMDVESALKPTLETGTEGLSEVLQIMGQAYLQLGRYHEAATVLGKAVQKTPHAYRAWINLGLVYMKLNDLDSAESAFIKAQSLHPKGDLPIINLALCHKNKGLLLHAEALLNTASTLNPGRWETYSHRALVAFEQGDYSKSATYAAEARKCPDCGAEAYVRSCAASLALGDTEQAIKFAHQAADMNPQYRSILDQLG